MSHTQYCIAPILKGRKFNPYAFSFLLKHLFTTAFLSCMRNSFTFESMTRCMKITLLFTFSIVVSFGAFAQVDQDKLFYFKKIEKYRKMKTTGTVLTLTGTALVVVGVVTIVNSTTTTNGTYTTTNDSNIVAGVIAYLVGVGGVGSGIPLWIVGGINEGKYIRRSQESAVRLDLDPQKAGLRLRYRF